MNDIRFNPINTLPEPQKSRFKFPIKKISLILLAVLILTAAVLIFTDFYKTRNTADPNASSYYAVFLSDGQIYFGEIVKNNEKEMVISNVYHLQSNGQMYQSLNQNQAVPAGATFSLIKLSDELHGPTDKMFINRNHILFYEQLKKDSKVVELINAQKN